MLREILTAVAKKNSYCERSKKAALSLLLLIQVANNTLLFGREAASERLNLFLASLSCKLFDASQKIGASSPNRCHLRSASRQITENKDEACLVCVNDRTGRQELLISQSISTIATSLPYAHACACPCGVLLSRII